MKRTLVTGGAGFIGSHLARRLLRERCEVYIVDNFSTGFKENVPLGAELVVLDLSKDDFVRQLPDKSFDAVFHLAAQSSGEVSFDDPMYDLKTNCSSTLLLLDWCYKKGIPRFIYTSSMSVYGEHEKQPVRESVSLYPKSFYGVGKLASEGYVNIYYKMGIQTTSLRLFNVYGPGQNMSNLRQGMISIYMAYLMRGEKLIVKGSPERYRDFIYIDDVIDAYLMCFQDPRSYGKTYNVASGVKTCVSTLLRASIEAFGHDPAHYPIHYGDPTPGDMFGIYADTRSILSDVGWSSKVSFDTGLRQMVHWIKNGAGVVARIEC